MYLLFALTTSHPCLDFEEHHVYSVSQRDTYNYGFIIKRPRFRIPAYTIEKTVLNYREFNYRVGWHSGNNSYLYSGGGRFEFRLGIAILIEIGLNWIELNFSDFPQILQENLHDGTSIRSQLRPSTFFQNYHSLLTVKFTDIYIYLDVLTASNRSVYLSVLPTNLRCNF